MSSPARRLLLPGFLAVVTPSPTPSAGPIDSATLGEQQLAYFDQLGTSIKLAVLHAFVFTLHALLLAAEVAVAAGLVVLIGRIATPHVRRAINRRPVTGLRILPPTDACFQPEAWLACFRALYSIATPWWKSWLTGQSAIVFEYRAEAGRVSTNCWFPADLAHTVSNALTRAIPGVELRAEEEVELPRPPQARARLRLWSDPLYPLGAPRVDALASAVAGLAECQDGLLQVSVAPDTGWERRASRRLEQLSGDGPTTPLAIRILLKLLILPFDLFFEIFWSSSSTRTYYQPAPRPRPKPIRPRVPDEKAYQACWRVDVRMCSFGDDARHGLRSVAAAFQALDDENRLRQKRVWWRPGFDHSVRNRLGPASGNLVLTAAELTQICHLPLVSCARSS